MRYLVYAVDLSGVARAAYELNCPSDKDAEVRAKTFLEAHPTVEVWEGPRRVARLIRESGTLNIKNEGGFAAKRPPVHAGAMLAFCVPRRSCGTSRQRPQGLSSGSACGRLFLFRVRHDEKWRPPVDPSLNFLGPPLPALVS